MEFETAKEAQEAVEVLIIRKFCMVVYLYCVLINQSTSEVKLPIGRQAGRRTDRRMDR